MVKRTGTPAKMIAVAIGLALVSLLLMGGGYLRAMVPTHWGGQTHVHLEPEHHKHAPAAVDRPAMTSLACVNGMAGPFPCHNIDLLAFVPTNSLSGGGSSADIWGWTDPASGREFAINTHSTTVSFVEVTDPVNPVYLGALPPPVPNVLWRDAKVYNNHVYIVGDGNFSPAPEHGLQIFDLTELLSVDQPPVLFNQSALMTTFGNAHNIAINEESGVGYVVGSNLCDGGLYMLDLSDPLAPTELGCYEEDGYTHDAQCVIYRGPDSDHFEREICLNANEDTLTIVDVTDKANPVMLSRTGYLGYSYTHQGWLTEDQRYFILGDELDEQDSGHNTHSYLWDLADLDAPVQLPTYVGETTAIDHNIYTHNGFVYEANYTAGLRILDGAAIGDGTLTEVAYFDTHPGSDVNQFAGAWSSYPYFESGVVIVSNIEDGLYILRPHLPGQAGPDPVGGGKVTGGGWVGTGEGSELNFGFNAQETAEGTDGELRLNDRRAGVKIRIDAVSAIGALAGDCGAIAPGPAAIEFRGEGTFNGSPATFRVCAEDNGEGKKAAAPDRFALECLDGCGYSTAYYGDGTLGGGNIRLHEASEGGTPPPAEDSGAAVLVLDPLLTSEGSAGAIQLFEVRAYDQDGAPLAGEAITLETRASDGSTATLSAISDGSGVALFTSTIATGPSEYIARSGALESNRILINGLLP